MGTEELEGAKKPHSFSQWKGCTAQITQWISVELLHLHECVCRELIIRALPMTGPAVEEDPSIFHRTLISAEWNSRKQAAAQEGAQL